jgi:hypothetical protein
MKPCPSCGSEHCGWAPEEPGLKSGLFHCFSCWTGGYADDPGSWLQSSAPNPAPANDGATLKAAGTFGATDAP